MRFRDQNEKCSKRWVLRVVLLVQRGKKRWNKEVPGPGGALRIMSTKKKCQVGNLFSERVKKVPKKFRERGTLASYAHPLSYVSESTQRNTNNWELTNCFIEADRSPSARCCLLSWTGDAKNLVRYILRWTQEMVSWSLILPSSLNENVRRNGKNFEFGFIFNPKLSAHSLRAGVQLRDHMYIFWGNSSDLPQRW